MCERIGECLLNKYTGYIQGHTTDDHLRICGVVKQKTTKTDPSSTIHYTEESLLGITKAIQTTPTAAMEGLLRLPPLHIIPES